MSEYKYIPKKPIQLSRDTVCLIQLFRKKNGLDDLMFCDQPDYIIHSYDLHEKSAQEFVEQLEGHWCTLFMEHLVKEVLRAVKKDEGTKLYQNMLEHILSEHSEEVKRLSLKKEKESSREIDNSLVPPVKTNENIKE